MLARSTGFLVALAVAVTCGSATAAEPSYLRLKAAYLVNIARFVSWPETESSEQVTLCIPVASDLVDFEDMLDGRPVGSGRTLKVVRARSPFADCQILYLDKFGASAEAYTVLAQSKYTLVVAESTDAWERGYAVQMYTRDLKLRLAINEDIVMRSQYEMSSKLLRLYRRLN